MKATYSSPILEIRGDVRHTTMTQAQNSTNSDGVSFKAHTATSGSENTLAASETSPE